MMNPYFSHIETNTTTEPSSYPIVTAYPNQDECCSTLDGSESALDEERGDIHADHTATDPNSHDMDHRSHSPTGAFASLSRRILRSPPVKKIIFFSCVFLVLSSLALAAVGLGLSFARDDDGVHGGEGYFDVPGHFHGGDKLMSSVEKAMITVDDLIVNVTSKVTASIHRQANSTALPAPTVANIESTEVWGTEPTTTSTDAVALLSTEASIVDTPDNDTPDELNSGMKVPANLIDVEFSMSMILFDDEFSMPDFPQDFEQFDAEFDLSMSMPVFAAESEEDDFPPVDDEIDVSMSIDTNAESISTESTELAVATKPFPNRDCVESMCSVKLSPELLMEYQLVVPTEMALVDSECQDCAVTIKLTYDGIAWIGFGFSTNGAMVGSEAVIGVPVPGTKQVPQKYILGGMSVDDIQRMSAEHQTLENASIKVGKEGDEIKTVMKFTKILKEEDEIQVFTGDNTFIWAHGFDETLGYHAARSTLELNLVGDTSEPTTPSTPMVTNPTTSQMVTEGTVAMEATSASSTVPGTIVPNEIDIMTDASPTVAVGDTVTEGTVTTEVVTGGTIVSGAFDVSATFTEPTTEQLASKNSSGATDSSNSPTYYPTKTAVMLTDVLTPVADTFLEFNSSESFGIRSRLRVDGQPQRITLIRFDMSPLVLNKAVELLSVKLRLYALTSSAYGGRVDIIDEDICNEWDEGISWTTAPPGVFADTPESIGTFGEISEYKWNDAALTLNLQFLPLQFTVRITSYRGNGVTYASKENSTAVPKLMIRYMGTPYEGTKVPTPSPVASLSQSAFEMTSSPTDRPTNRPITDAPTVTPAEPIEIKVGRDAMLRNGVYSNNLFGYDPFIAMKSSTNPDWEGKSILQFDLSDLTPDVDYSYKLKLFVTYVGEDDERTITVFQLTENFLWGEEWITWDRLGNPAMDSLGSGDIASGDVGSYVTIPLGQLKAIKGRVNLVVEITSGPSEGSKVDYMARENGSNPPLLIASP